MTWNPSPKVAKARDIGNEYKQNIVIITMLNNDNIETISYGKTKELCREADRLGKIAQESIIEYYKQKEQE